MNEVELPIQVTMALHEADLMEFRLRQVRKILSDHRAFASKFITHDQQAKYLAEGIDLALKEIGQ